MFAVISFLHHVSPSVYDDVVIVGEDGCLRAKNKLQLDTSRDPCLVCLEVPPGKGRGPSGSEPCHPRMLRHSGKGGCRRVPRGHPDCYPQHDKEPTRSLGMNGRERSGHPPVRRSGTHPRVPPPPVMASPQSHLQAVETGDPRKHPKCSSSLSTSLRFPASPLSSGPGAPRLPSPHFGSKEAGPWTSRLRETGGQAGGAHWASSLAPVSATG